MKLFGRKKEEKKCCCGGNCDKNSNTNITNKENEKGIKILGSGCKKCNDLEENTKIALKELNLDLEIEHITDFTQIATYGVMTTPALVVDGKVVSYGKVLNPEEIKAFFK